MDISFSGSLFEFNLDVQFCRSVFGRDHKDILDSFLSDERIDSGP